MKRIFLSVLILLSSHFFLSALDNKYEDYFSFTITPQFEVANGNIMEYVFDSDCKNTDSKLSELRWNVSTIALINLKADFSIIKYIYLGLSGTAAVPQRSDLMQDYDWENGLSSYPYWINDDPTEYTKFSEHINTLDKYVTFKISLGGNVYLPAKITLTPHLAYQYEFIGFTASGGYGEYKNDSKAITRKTFNGKVISYVQEANSVFLGLKLSVDCIPRTTIRLNFDISPKLTFLNAIDYHYINRVSSGTAYKDSFKNLLQIETDATIQYRFTKNHSTGIYGKIQYIPLSKGQTTSRLIDKDGNFTSSEWLESPSEGGTERYIWSLGLNYSFSL